MSALQCGELGSNLALGVYEGSQYENIWQEFGTMMTLITMIMAVAAAEATVMMMPAVEYRGGVK